MPISLLAVSVPNELERNTQNMEIRSARNYEGRQIKGTGRKLERGSSFENMVGRTGSSSNMDDSSGKEKAHRASLDAAKSRALGESSSAAPTGPKPEVQAAYLKAVASWDDNRDRSFDELLMAARMGSNNAMVILGQLYIGGQAGHGQGHGAQPSRDDMEQGLALLEIAARQGNVEAVGCLGAIYKDGLKVATQVPPPHPHTPSHLGSGRGWLQSMNHKKKKSKSQCFRC